MRSAGDLSHCPGGGLGVVGLGLDELVEARLPRPVLCDEGLVRAEHDAPVVAAPQVSIR